MAGTLTSGRKTAKEEMDIIRRYADLTVPYFKFIKEMLDPESDKDDRKWAAERLDKAFPKFIPQTLEASHEGFTINLITYGDHDSLSIRANAVALGSSSEPSQIQGDSSAQESSEDDTSNQ